MPSKKKARGKARKVAKELKNHVIVKNACNHFKQTNRILPHESLDCNALRVEFHSKESILNTELDGTDRYYTALFHLIMEEMGPKYARFSERAKQTFKEMMLADGTQQVVFSANETDLTKEIKIAAALPSVFMLICIEIREDHGPIWDKSMTEKLYRNIAHIICCPREVVKFLHRRNGCDCLKEIYYKLKESTTRTTYCEYCQEVKDIREIQWCECNVAQYCSVECQMKDRPRHKQSCKLTKRAPDTADTGGIMHELGTNRVYCLDENDVMVELGKMQL